MNWLSFLLNLPLRPSLRYTIPSLGYQTQPPGGINEGPSEEITCEHYIGDDGSSSTIKILDIESTTVALRSLRMNVLKSPGTHWAKELIIDSGANASLVCEGRLLNKLVPLCSKVKGIDDTLLLDVKGQGSLRIKLENGTIIEIKGVLYVPDSKFNLVWYH